MEGTSKYFRNWGTRDVPDTIQALQLIGAHSHAELLNACYGGVIEEPSNAMKSLEDYADLAATRSFDAEDNAYYDVSPGLLELIESHYEALLNECVAVRA